MIRLEIDNDTIMNKLMTQILGIFTKDSILSSSQIFEKLKNYVGSQVTIKRHLTMLVDNGYLEIIGSGRSVKYKLSDYGYFLRPFNVDEYLAINESNRGAQTSFNSDIFKSLDTQVFTLEEKEKMNKAYEYFQKNKIESSETIHKKELERFTIELSWKSSKIEGNTYTLLDTALLLQEGLKSNKNTESETRMIINHKKAFDYIFSNKDYFRVLSLKKIEEIHNLHTEDLGIKRNIRKSPVGVTGTSYRPLDNEYQIREAMEQLVRELNKIQDTHVKALFAILMISYIQPFEDANKRTSRLLGNAILLSADYAPLSYRDVDEVLYRAATLIFYEQNSVEAFKKIFIEQYVFSCKTYNLGWV